MSDKTLGAYERHNDETAGEALARIQATFMRMLDEADAALRDDMDGGVTAARIEEEAERKPTADARYCAWVDYRKDFQPSALHLTAAHKAFVAGWDASRDEGGWSPVRECPDPEQHEAGPFDLAVLFRDERDEARAMAARWKEATRREVRKVHADDGLVMRAIRAAKTLATENGILREELKKAEQDRGDVDWKARVEKIEKIESERDYWLREHGKQARGWIAANEATEQMRAERDAARAEAESLRTAVRERGTLIKDLRARAEKAEEHVEDLSHDLEAARAEMAACDVHDGVIEVTDEMVERAVAAWEAVDDTATIRKALTHALTAALTPPPARHPEAEALADAMEEYSQGGALDEHGLDGLADHLAGLGWTKEER